MDASTYRYRKIISLNIIFTLALISIGFSVLNLWTLGLAAFSLIYLYFAIVNNDIDYWNLWLFAPFCLKRFAEKKEKYLNLVLENQRLEVKISDLDRSLYIAKDEIWKLKDSIASVKQSEDLHKMEIASLKRDRSRKELVIGQLNSEIADLDSKFIETSQQSALEVALLEKALFKLERVSRLIDNFEENESEIRRQIRTGLNEKLKILHAEDDELQVDQITSVFNRNKETIGDYEYTNKVNGIEALDFFKENRNAIDIIISDQEMGGKDLNGERFVKAVRSIDKNIPVIVCSGTDPDKLRYLFEGSNVTKYVEKHRINDLVSHLSSYRITRKKLPLHIARK